MTRTMTIEVPFAFGNLSFGDQRDTLMRAIKTLNVTHQGLAASVVHAVDDELNGHHDQRNPRDFDLWHVQVTVSRPVEGGWTAQRTLPTFTLDGALHGIESVKGAATIAADVLLVDVQPEAWQFVAVIRRGNTDQVFSANLATMNVWEGDHVSDRKDLS